MSAVTKFTGLGFLLVTQLDNGATLDVGETEEHAEDGSLWNWLKTQFPDLDLTLLSPEDLAEICELFRELGSGGTARSRFGVTNNGLLLLLAWCLEGAQRAGTDQAGG